MVTTLLLPRLLNAAEGSANRAVAVAWRNMAAAKHLTYWLVLASGFVEPVLYLLSIGVGVGGFINGFTLTGGHRISYAEFVAPAMLGTSAMNGAFAETSMNFFGKMKYRKLYDAVICTPVTPFEIASGELLWGLLRGSAYSGAFLVVMVVAGLTTPLRAVCAFPVTVLVGIAFGSIGMLAGTFLRSWQGFDYLMTATVSMFLFSGTFAPIDTYPGAVRFLIELTPLYHGVAAIRGLTTWSIGLDLVGNLAYLVLVAGVTLWTAARRVRRALCP